MKNVVPTSFDPYNEITLLLFALAWFGLKKVNNSV